MSGSGIHSLSSRAPDPSRFPGRRASFAPVRASVRILFALGGYDAAMNSASAPRAMQPSSELASGNQVSSKGRILAWASWDWGSAAFNAVMTTFVFTVYLTSNAFGGKDEASAVLGGALAVAGLAIALLAPVTGQRSDAGGRRKLWLGVNTAAVAVLTALCFFVFPQPEFLLLASP
ncbi:MFS transporter, UMF1 family [Pseudarthrobacter equi]|uniref:MFS transporter, UMF1 family n=1 Tax=Pseudarthrobacter equi TaxID=728066 RepID=A0A1H1S0E7_9MICC|nr:MFS transporter, UMF1 family [Pseudarthrobacter equi]